MTWVFNGNIMFCYFVLLGYSSMHIYIYIYIYIYRMVIKIRNREHFQCLRPIWSKTHGRNFERKEAQLGAHLERQSGQQSLRNIFPKYWARQFSNCYGNLGNQQISKPAKKTCRTWRSRALLIGIPYYPDKHSFQAIFALSRLTRLIEGFLFRQGIRNWILAISVTTGPPDMGYGWFKMS